MTLSQLPSRKKTTDISIPRYRLACYFLINANCHLIVSTESRLCDGDTYNIQVFADKKLRGRKVTVL